MIVIGLLLLIAALVFGVELIFANHSVHIASPDIFGQSLGIHSAAAVFTAGAMTGAAVLLGLMLVASGIRRQGAKAVKHRRAAKAAARARDQRDELAANNLQLHAELDKERATTDSPPLTTVERTVEVTDTTEQRAAALSPDDNR